MKELIPFYQAADHPGTLPGLTPKKILGTFCTYVPEELIVAAGFVPMRLFPSGADIVLAENHLQSCCCSHVRGILEDSLAGNLDFLHGAVFVQTCDTMQRLSDIWRLQHRYRFFADVILPAKMNTPSAENYIAAVLERFKVDLESHTGRPVTREALSFAITLYNRIRRNLAHIYDLTRRYPAMLSPKDLSVLVKATLRMDREKAAELLDHLIIQLEQGTPDSGPSGPGRPKRLFVSGSVCDTPGLFDLFRQTGAVVAGDDLCTGRRWFDGQIPEDMDPMAAITQHYARRKICPAKHHGLYTRADQLIQQVREARADGVVFVLLKFCDPHAFDYPYLKACLDDAGIKSMALELDNSQDSHGQVATRVETFVHML
jgi:benzoyl-CoA reductase/2-hydroxyglutaryl-CoA dehydratase subunit BcrC/BadD/HgdB